MEEDSRHARSGPAKPGPVPEGMLVRMNREDENLTFSTWLAAGCLALLTYVLLIPPSVGIADNGDYARVMVFHDLTHAPKEWGDRYFGYLNTSFVFDREESRRYASPDFACSALVFTGMAVGASSLFQSHSFSLRVLGAVHCLVFALAVFWIASATRPFRGAFRSAAIVIGLLAFTDIAYSAYLNSFYSEAASLLFLGLLLGSGFQVCTAGSRRLLWIAVFLAAAAGFLLAKYQNLLLLPFLLVFAWRALLRVAASRIAQLFLAAALILSYAGYRFWMSSPAAVGEAVLYNSVFNGILRDSPSAEKDLEDLGLDRAWVQYAGSSAFEPTSLRFQPEFAQRFLKVVDIGTVFRFYLSQPYRLGGALQRGIRHAFMLRPPEYGNYEKSAGKPPGAKSYSWAMWSTARIAVLPRSLWFLSTLIAGYLAVLVKEWRRDALPSRRLALEMGSIIPFMALQQLLLFSISDGVGDMVKHGFLFNVMVDIMLVALIAYGWSLWVNRQTRTAKEALHSPVETAK